MDEFASKRLEPISNTASASDNSEFRDILGKRRRRADFHRQEESKLDPTEQEMHDGTQPKHNLDDLA
jgi:hypothetical protein